MNVDADIFSIFYLDKLFVFSDIALINKEDGCSKLMLENNFFKIL